MSPNCWYFPMSGQVVHSSLTLPSGETISFSSILEAELKEITAEVDTGQIGLKYFFLAVFKCFATQISVTTIRLTCIISTRLRDLQARGLCNCITLPDEQFIIPFVF